MFAIKGDIVYSKVFGKLEIIKSGYILVDNNIIIDTFSKLPDEYENINVIDYTGMLIIPGFVDLHLHAPQYANMGIGLDKELLPWLETYTFPEESKFKNIDYAERIYSKLIEEIWKNGTTRCCVFGTIHKESTELLMELFNKSGLGAYVGKVNMDINCPDYIKEHTEESINDTNEILINYKDKYNLVKPILTPRFIPACSDNLMKGIAKLATKYNTPLQSHLSENLSEINFVKSLFPMFDTYTDVYKDYGLLINNKTIMAHCIHLSNREISILKDRNVYIAHCPTSNSNLSSGMAPIRKYIAEGVKVGIGSDIAGGHTLSICQVISHAIQISNIKYIESNYLDLPLTVAEGFYLATKGGGEFFGNIGSFEKGYIFDALIIDDKNNTILKELSIYERLEKFIYNYDYNNIVCRYVNGKKVNKPTWNN